jgi:predicted nucleotidyltransferase
MPRRSCGGICPIPPIACFCSGHARRERQPRSDIDIGIEGPGPVPREAMALIEEELEEAPTLYTIEVVDFARVSENFRRVANRRIPL